MSIYCLLKERLGILKVLLRIYLVFGFFGAIWHFWRVDLAFFAYDYLATLITNTVAFFSTVLDLSLSCAKIFMLQVHL